MQAFGHRDQHLVGETCCIFFSSFSFLSMKLSCTLPPLALQRPWRTRPCGLILFFLRKSSSGRRSSLSNSGGPSPWLPRR